MPSPALPALSLLALLAAWRLAPPHTLPLYDGICATEPYKYVAAPPSGAPAGGTPGGETKTDTLVSPTDALQLSTQDNDVGPAQAEVTVPPGSLAIDAPTTLHVSLVPLAPPATPPVKGHVIGNAYRVRITDDRGTAIGLRRGASITVYLLPPKAVPGTTVQRLDGDRWTVLDTSSTPSCTNTIQASSDRLGVFAMVDPNPAPGAASQGTPAWLTPAIAVAGVLAVLAALLLLLRVRRGAGRAP